MKIKFLAVTALLGLISLGACKKSVPNTNVSLKNDRDSISYAYGVNATQQQIDKWLVQSGVLKDTLQITMEYGEKMKNLDAVGVADLTKERDAKIAKAKIENQEAIDMLIAGLAKGLNLPETDKAYYIGVGLGQQMDQNLHLFEEYFFGDSITKVNKDALVAGFANSLDKPQNQKDFMLYIQEKDQEITQKKSQEEMKKAEENLAKGQAFMDQNASKEGVQTLPNGIQYKVLKAAKPNGKKAKVDGQVNVDYKGYLIDGTEFDSGQNVPMSLANVIQGWQEVIPMMQEGAEWQIVIPSELAYGQRGAGDVIKPNSVLCFDITLNEVK